MAGAEIIPMKFHIGDTLKQVPKFRELQAPNYQVPGTLGSEITK